MGKKTFRSCFLLSVLFLCAALAFAQKPADLSRLVVIGDSLAAGYQNGSLLATQQVHGPAALVAAQKGVSLTLPLIAEPGVPNVLTLVDPGPPPVVAPAPGTSSGRLNPTEMPMNLAVPGAFLHDALATRPDFSFSDMTDLVLGLPGVFTNTSLSQVEWAEALHPTTALIWIGNMDALYAAIFVANPAALTPVAAFEADYKEIMDRLAATGATLVVANLPDVTVVPYLIPAEDIAELAGAPLALIGPALGIAPGDYVIIDALPLIQKILTGAVPGPLPEDVVLTATEAASIRARVDEYNAIIAAQAAEKGAALVDVYGTTRRMQRRGYVAGGHRLTTDFLGGLFSLDGVHPSRTGYAIIANEIIQALNTSFAAGIPPVVIEHVASEDPLVMPFAGRPASALNHVDPLTAQTLRKGLTSR